MRILKIDETVSWEMRMLNKIEKWDIFPKQLKNSVTKFKVEIKTEEIFETFFKMKI